MYLAYPFLSYFRTYVNVGGNGDDGATIAPLLCSWSEQIASGMEYLALKQVFITNSGVEETP